MPSSAQRSTSWPMRHAPSSTEYSEWTCRWTYVGGTRLLGQRDDEDGQHTGAVGRRPGGPGRLPARGGSVGRGGVVVLADSPAIRHARRDMPAPRRIVIPVFDEVQTLDVTGPAEVFATA